MSLHLAIENPAGELIKRLQLSGEALELGYHRIFGFLPSDRLKQKLRARANAGLRKGGSDALFDLRIENRGGKVTLSAARNAELTQEAEGLWKLRSPAGEYRMRVAGTQSAPVATVAGQRQAREDDRRWVGIAALAAIGMGLSLLIPSPAPREEQPEVSEPVTVQIKPLERAVVVPRPQSSVAETVTAKIQASPQAKRAIQQNLGFLGILGKKSLDKALGGMPSTLEKASPGAGAGGNEGSGGELLVGLGQGVKRTTVGNSGVAGLGGVGTKGKGGGGGGYGNSWVGSGEGKVMSSVALSQDIELEGGLDRNVIQATIAKYISQVRACYEEGLRSNAGLTGQVMVNFEILGGGNLSFARVGRTTLGNSKVEGCITDRMLGWKFPKPVGGVAVKVSYPFLLRPSRSSG